MGASACLWTDDHGVKTGHRQRTDPTNAAASTGATNVGGRTYVLVKEAGMQSHLIDAARPTLGTPTARRRSGPTLVPVGDARWRVVMEGRIIGHLDELTDVGGARFRASRYRRATGSLVTVGEFFRQRDAIDALRYAC
jgi:hypothetical protein